MKDSNSCNGRVLRKTEKYNLFKLNFAIHRFCVTIIIIVFIKHMDETYLLPNCLSHKIEIYLIIIQ